MNIFIGLVLAVLAGQSAAQSNCNYILTDGMGGFSSPNFPSNYDNDLNCHWYIILPEDVPINLTFTSFLTESSLDIVRVYNGLNVSSSTLLLEWSGKALPPPVSSTGGVMLITFTTDSSNVLSGFQASYTAPTSQSPGCNYILTSATGTLNSPNYPNNYENDLKCQWFIIQDDKVNLTFTSFDVEQDYDFVKIYDGPNVWSPLLLTISGKVPPPPIVSSGNALLVVFTSDDTGVYPGFQATYSTATPPPPDCNFVLTDSDGKFTSPNFPDNYFNNLNCQWGIVVGDKARITLTFDSFDSEFSVDTVKVYDGRTTSSPLLLVHSGAEIPPAVESSGQILLVVFTTNGEITRPGFQAKYFSAVDCNYLLTSTSGVFRTINYPGNYENDLDCKWNFLIQENIKINLTFNTFDTEGLVDYVRVYDGPSTLYPLLLETSGVRVPPPVISSRNSLLVTFTSDYRFPYPGFEAVYSAAAPQWTNCNFLLTDSQGELSSPNYPTTSYEDNLNCRWLITVPSNLKVSLVFDSFWTEVNKDVVEIFDGADTTAPLLLTNSGQVIPSPIVSSGNQLLVAFTTNEIGTLPGFHASYTTEDPENPSCTTVLTGSSGTFSSPNYPFNYDNNVNCQWRIIIQPTANEQSYIQLRFDSFDTQISYDFIRVYNGPTTSSPLLLVHSGPSIPPPVLSSGGNLLIVFTSDSSVTARGFQASYSLLTCLSGLGDNSWCTKLPSPQFYDRCHCFSAVGRTWATSQAFCSTYQMALVSVETEEENDLIVSELNSRGFQANKNGANTFWTSGSDAANEKQFVWTATGQPFDYTNWAAGSPDNTASHDYVGMNAGATAQWNDLANNNIGRNIFTICESNQN